jgi:3-oxoacyl-[acyl-carrier protein] reductase
VSPLLVGRVAFITGAGSGIGRAISMRFAEEGAAVAAVDLNERAASETADAVRRLGGRAEALRADVANAADVEAAAHRAQAALGRLDILVNNAGVTRDATIRKMTDEDWDVVIAVHLRGTFLCTRAVVPRIREGGRGGAVVNMSSISGKMGNFGQANYAAAKAGIVALTKVTAREYARYGIRANAIQPGLIDTPMARALGDDLLKQRVADTPLGRIGRPDEVANVALFLASDLSSYVTGAVVEVTGGRYV